MYIYPISQLWSHYKHKRSNQTKQLSAATLTYVAKTVVFWYMEDCKIPDGLNAGEVSQNIIKSLVNKGYHGTVEIKAYGESKDDLTSSGIKLKHFSAGELNSFKLYNILFSFTIMSLYLDLCVDDIWFQKMEMVELTRY